jgi:hypothetical protein
LWNTTAGSDNTISAPGSSVGDFFASEMPEYAFDQVVTTKYTNFGVCSAPSPPASICGTNTGLFLTLRRGASLLLAFRFSTGNNFPDRDPLTVTIEGSNQPTSSLILGAEWTLIYNGSTGLDSDPGRYSFGVLQNLTSNTVWYTSYRLLITSKRGLDTSVQYGEIELLG